jgi:hypothetical protein
MVKIGHAFGMGRRYDTSLLEDASCEKIAAEKCGRLSRWWAGSRKTASGVRSKIAALLLGQCGF